jgi:hypothetical protein
MHAGLKSRLEKVEAKRNANVGRITCRVILHSETTGYRFAGYVPKDAVVTGRFVVFPAFESDEAWEVAALEQQTALLKLATSRTNEPAESVGNSRAVKEANELMGRIMRK